MITTETYEPLDRQVNPRCGEWQTGHIVGDGETEVFRGNGEIGKVFNNVAVSGTVDFHDATLDDLLDATNRIVRAHTDNAGIDVNTTAFSVRRGLVVVTSASTADITFQLRGRPTVSPRTFGGPVTV